MKKVLALVLAVMMMATVAFADITVGAGGAGENSSDLNPGDKLIIKASAFNGDGAIPGDKLTSEYFAVSTKKFSTGQTLVENVKFNDDDATLEVITKQNYELEAPKAANLVVDTIKIKCKKAIKNAAGDTIVKKGSTWIYNNATKDLNVGYLLTNVNISEDFEIDVYKDSGVKFESEKAKAGETYAKYVKFAKDETSYGTATIAFEDVATVTGRVYDKEKVFLDYDQAADVDIVKKYPDADLTFVNFKGAPTFNSNMTLEVYADEDMYIYEIKDKKVAPVNMKWDEDSYSFTGKVRTLGAYVISDTKLSVETTAADGNPDTGANDVVGIATALAAVALVSAAAVSLKK